MKRQIVLIHGGDSFRTRKDYVRSLRTRPVALETFRSKSGWKSTLPNTLGPKFQVFSPQMPNKANARYAEWKIWFERMIPYLHHNVILVGHSLGGMFLAKYLAENTFPRRITAVILVAAPHNKTADIGDFRLPKSLARFSRQSKNIYLLHSPDDPIVPFSELGVYARALPQAKTIVVQRRGHFNQERFPELVRLIKRLR